MAARLTLLTLLCPVLASCGQSEPEPAPSPTPTVATPRTLVGANLACPRSARGSRGRRGRGRDGAERGQSAGRDAGKLCRLPCRPRAAIPPNCLPTTYTYVHRITLAESGPAETTEAPETATEAPPTLFRTTRKATGFNQAIGFSTDEAADALGDPDAISIVNDNGALIWRLVRGTGGQPGKTVTLWWQSTTPPQGPARAFAFEIDGAQIEASGPFPPEDKPVERTTQR